MAIELLFKIIDTPADVNDDLPAKEMEVRRYHRGDCITFHDEGWGWTPPELTNPDWRIIRINLTISEAKALKSQELNVLGVKKNKWKRLRKLDFDNILVAGKLKDFLLDDTRAVPIFKFSGRVGLFTDITVIKPNADVVVGVL